MTKCLRKPTSKWKDLFCSWGFKPSWWGDGGRGRTFHIMAARKKKARMPACVAGFLLSPFYFIQAPNLWLPILGGGGVGEKEREREREREREMLY
jgi:hypothetical protein